MIAITVTATTGRYTQSYSGLYVPDPRGRRKLNECMNERMNTVQMQTLVHGMQYEQPSFDTQYGKRCTYSS